jgi:hypothetical protein
VEVARQWVSVALQRSNGRLLLDAAAARYRRADVQRASAHLVDDDEDEDGEAAAGPGPAVRAMVAGGGGGPAAAGRRSSLADAAAAAAAVRAARGTGAGDADGGDVPGSQDVLAALGGLLDGGSGSDFGGAASPGGDSVDGGLPCGGGGSATCGSSGGGGELAGGSVAVAAELRAWLVALPVRHSELFVPFWHAVFESPH